MRAYICFMDHLNRAVKLILAALLTAMSLVIIIQVIYRGLKISLPWSEEFSRYVMIYIVFLGTGYAVRYDLLMSVKILWEHVPEKAVKGLSILVNLLMAAFFLLLIVQGIKILGTVGNQTSPAMLLPMSVPYGAMPVGGALMFLNSLAVIAEDIVGKEG